MRTRSTHFDNLFNQGSMATGYTTNAVFEYRLIVTPITSPPFNIENDMLYGKVEWIDGLSDGDEFCVGNAFMGELKFTLRDFEGSKPKTSDTIQAYMRLNDGINPSEWILIGKYRVVDASYEYKTKRWSYRCYDNMYYLDSVMFFKDNAPTFPMTYTGAIQGIKVLSSVPIDFPSEAGNLKIEDGGIYERDTLRTVLAYMLMTIGANCRCNPNGNLEIYYVNDDLSNYDAIISEYDYNTPMEENKAISGIRVVNNDNSAYTVGNDNSFMLNVRCPWGRQEHAQFMYNKMNGYLHTPVILDNAIVNPCIEPNDRVLGLVSGQIYRVSYVSPKGATMLRIDCQNGIWQQYDYATDTTSQAGKKNGNTGGGDTIPPPPIIFPISQEQYLPINFTFEAPEDYEDMSIGYAIVSEIVNLNDNNFFDLGVTGYWDGKTPLPLTNPDGTATRIVFWGIVDGKFTQIVDWKYIDSGGTHLKDEWDYLPYKYLGSATDKVEGGFFNKYQPQISDNWTVYRNKNDWYKWTDAYSTFINYTQAFYGRYFQDISQTLTYQPPTISGTSIGANWCTMFWNGTRWILCLWVWNGTDWIDTEQKNAENDDMLLIGSASVWVRWGVMGNVMQENDYTMITRAAYFERL